MRFSQRTAWDVSENAHAAAIRHAGSALLDLTVSNPTACGFHYDSAAILGPLGQPEALSYRPDALGIPSARAAVLRYYADHAASLEPEQICLTTSTSEGYSFLFRLLCDPGDEVLVASPSYPLFDFIATLDGVRLVQYPLLYDDHWLTDIHALRQAITPRTRALIVVHPNNPTGHFCTPTEQASLDALCAEHGLALIIDEVFLDYPLDPTQTPRSFAAMAPAALTFVLSGISKVCGLPQMKCSWVAALGPAEKVERAMDRLEVIADTFLSMSAPVQHALPTWLAARHDIQSQVLDRVRRNLDALDPAIASAPMERLHTEAGWAAILRVPRTVAGAAFAEVALAAGVLVHPGSFYGLSASRIVLSLLTPPEAWDEGIERLAKLSSTA